MFVVSPIEMTQKIRCMADYAAVCWEANRAYCQYVMDEVPPVSWAAATDEERKYIQQQVTKILLEGGSPESLHSNWCKEKKRKGWKWGKNKDEETQTHPSLVRYQNLPVERKMKNVLFHAILESFQGVLVNRNPFLPQVDWLKGEKHHE